MVSTKVTDEEDRQFQKGGEPIVLKRLNWQRACQSNIWMLLFLLFDIFKILLHERATALWLSLGH